ncbi:alpha/beta hydrolase fold domain-containing protein [Novosphingobium pentaromativorans]|uniref:Alpha/beta hydrolase fold-3 domain-containing protein n=1 Tax=Novosphingobium pentaromativorans US6-1 TaxID=1088721 RepID=G6EGP8_9SPHN|nr:alpha/beta hydrolase fold domain-containing protein [Novosphingobium pentaromativorans]AIT82099.1 hypothetical protein JI59_21425 [Novosphingobium pentaromativorans US6-1]EHJ59491.1 hypothetical protein NSU_3519 [Novosphingobium pentaromativorans US6-1]
MAEIHPEARAAQIDLVLDWARKAGLQGWNSKDCPTSRETFRAASAIKIVSPLPDLAQVSDISLSLRSGKRPARLYQSSLERDLPTIIYVHGGGYVVGGLVEADAECRRLAHSIGANLVSITYRLAPEYRYPSGIEDVQDAIGAICAGEAGIPCDRFAVLGVSAGAGLAVAAIRRILDEGGRKPAAAALLSPWLDLTLSLPSCDLYGTGHFQELSQLLDFRALYLPDGMTATARPELAPARNPLPENWPSTILLAAELDPLADDTALFQRRLAEAGIDHQCRYARGHLHGFHTWWQHMPSILPDLAWLDSAIASALRGVE